MIDRRDRIRANEREKLRERKRVGGIGRERK